MITPTRASELKGADLVPQAVLKLPIAEFARRFGGYFEDDHDDFDHYQGVFFTLDNKLPFAMKHYDGHPAGTSTLYLDGTVRDVETITLLVGRIVKYLQLPSDVIHWQRRDNPDL